MNEVSRIWRSENRTRGTGYAEEYKERFREKLESMSKSKRWKERWQDDDENE